MCFYLGIVYLFLLGIIPIRNARFLRTNYSPNEIVRLYEENTKRCFTIINLGVALPPGVKKSVAYK